MRAGRGVPPLGEEVSGEEHVPRGLRPGPSFARLSSERKETNKQEVRAGSGEDFQPKGE